MTAVTVLAAGPLATIQDAGRAGYGQWGVTRAGAFDLTAARLANRLVGNHPDEAAIEALAGGLVLRVTGSVLVAVTGAAGPVSVDGRAAARNAVLGVRAGSVLTLGPPERGLRSYVAVRGGFAATAVLGSRSWDSLGRIGHPPLAAGDELPVGTTTAHPPTVDAAPQPADPGDVTLTLLPGPRRDWFHPDAIAQLTARAFTVTAAADRVGLRLRGPALRRAPHAADRDLPPEGMVAGAVEVPPDGQPIILGPDHPTTGGYPVIAVLPRRELSRCAQLTPGSAVRFRWAP